jgi:hypothetical protein
MDRLCICCRADLTDNVVAVSVAQSMPTLKHGQAIRGHYRAGNELVVHARPCLALLPAYMASLSHVQHLRILGALWARPTQTGCRMQGTLGLPPIASLLQSTTVWEAYNHSRLAACALPVFV